MNIPSFRCNGIHLTPAEQAKCPICARKTTLFKIKSLIDKESFFGDSLTPFVGHYGYPNLNVGYLSLPEQNEQSWLHDAPSYWASKEYKIPQIVDLRSSLINSRFKLNIKQQSKLLEIGQEVAMASKPVDIEIDLNKKPSFQMDFSSYNSPMGPIGSLRRAVITDNPKIKASVEKVYSDTDLKAKDAMVYLYGKDFDEHFLTKILSIGTIGLKFQRKLVPTRWSVVSVDDTIGKHLINEIKSYNEVDSYTAYFGSYLGNYYLIMLFPEVWSYELFESYARTPLFSTTDFECYEGRKNYAENTVGGYYACRIGILEKLKKMKKQASVLVLRFITEEYTVPMGVFVCRETTRKSLQSNPIEFSSKELILKYASALIKKKFGLNIDEILKKSVLLNNLKTQKKLSEFT